MDERILVEVYVPAAQLHVDALLPAYVRIKDARKQLLKMLEESAHYEAGSFQHLQLYLADAMCYPQMEQYVWEAGVHHGEIIIMM